MKKSLFVLGLAAVVLTSCGEKKKEEVKKEVEETKVEAVQEEAATEASETAVATADLELGKKLFTEKTCATCHMPDTKVIGPAIKDINKIYSENNADIVKFLKGESEAIVDTDPGQVAIMKANIDGFVKDMTDDELAAVAAYMLSVK